MRDPNEDTSGARLQREINEMYGWNDTEVFTPSHCDTRAAGDSDDHWRSPEQEARDAGFASYEEYEDHLEDLNEG